MRWFNKGEQKEIWEEDIIWPLGDLEAANRIRAICSAASSSAEKLNGRAGKREEKRNQQDTERYERAAKTAMEIAMKISDDLVRDLCGASDHRPVHDGRQSEEPAGILLRAINAEAFREEVLNEHPALRRR